MKLLDLVSYFRRGGNFEQFCREQALDANSEAIEIYAEEPVTLDGQLSFFPAEVTQGRAHLQVNHVRYLSLFDFLYFLDAIEEVKGLPESKDVEIAQALLSYAIDDA